MIFWVVVGLVAIFFVAKLSLENRVDHRPVSGQIEFDPEDEETDGDFVSDLWGVSTADELMDVVNDWEDLGDNESEALLAKARPFENELDEEDWAEIYQISAGGSELERVAEEKAGDELE